MLCSHHLCLLQKHFIALKRLPVFAEQSLPRTPTPLATTNPPSPGHIPVFRTFCVSGTLSYVGFVMDSVHSPQCVQGPFKLYWGSELHSLSWLKNISPCVHGTAILSRNQLGAFEFFPAFGCYEIFVIMTFECVRVCTCICLSFHSQVFGACTWEWDCSSS